jgi:hypothetical protein
MVLTIGLGIEASAPCTIASLAVTLYDLQGTKLVNADTIAVGRTLRLEPGEHEVTLASRSCISIPVCT